MTTASIQTPAATIKIDKNMPTPLHGRNSLAKYPWRDMTVGDSFFVADIAIQSMSRNAAYAKKTVPGSKWATRTVTENGVKGIRVWRIE